MKTVCTSMEGGNCIRYKEIKAELLCEIQDMLPDSRLDSRPMLCKRLETTRTTLDRAIAELVGEGYLYTRSGSGTYVNNLKRHKMNASLVENWGVIIPTVMENVYAEIVKGIELYTAEKHINVILCNSDEDVDKQKRQIQRLMMSDVSGMIIVPTVCRSVQEGYQLFKQLIEAKIPFVFCNRGVDGVEAPLITSNDFYGAYIATKHLIEKGYRQIGYIAQTSYKTSQERCKGYVTALMEGNIPINRKLIVLEEKGRRNPPGYNTMERFMNENPELDAVFCFNDIVADGCLLAMEKHGKKLSDEIGIIGYDNSPLCINKNPGLTSIAYKSTQIGIKAAEVLQKMIHRKYLSDFNLYLFQPEIVIRESCKGPRSRRI